MSLCISVVTPEGIVVAGESRQTQVVSGVNRVASDSAAKVFELTDTVLAAAAGWGFLQPSGATIAKNIASLVADFKPSIPSGSTVQDASTLLWTHFNTLYQQQITQFPTTTAPAGQAALNFLVAGYDPGSATGTLFSLAIPADAPPTAPVRSTNQPGPWWIGQIDVVARIINGFDPRAINLPFVQAANQNANAGTTQLFGLQYAVYYNTMTLQDAIDFAVGLIQVTITVQRFTAGIANQRGAVAGLGGPIDVAVIQAGKPITWVSRKQLHP